MYLLKLSMQQQIFPKRGHTAGYGGEMGVRKAGNKNIKKYLQGKRVSHDFYDHNYIIYNLIL